MKMEATEEMAIEDQEIVTRRECDLLRKPIEEKLDEITKSLKAMWKKLDGRPSWTVLSIITFLSSLVAVLLTLVLSR